MAQITLRDYLQETEDVIGNGRVDDALDRCQYVLARFPESLEAQRLLGEVYLAQGHFDEAQQTFDWVLTNDPENVIVYCDRALISEGKADYDTALDCYQQAYELSRGNNRIRNEFNKLSAKVGQQGFMFSRAGLARLYMRGDLLTQAIQEWESVLAVTPDRLDARTGLLEAFWRDGLYDRVEQLATQILQDVPGCEKALLLLAYVISAKDMEQARELVQRTEALDPDLVMAQDLFSDLMASQPNEPFFALLKKTPVDLEKSQASVSSSNAALSRQEELFASPGASTAAGSLSGWSGLETWNGENTLLKASPEPQSAPLSSGLPVWSNDSFAALSDASNVLNQGLNSVAEATPQQQQPDLSTYLNAMSSSGTSWEMPAPPAQQSSIVEEQQSDPWASLQGFRSEIKEPEAPAHQDQPQFEVAQRNNVEEPSESSLSGFGWGSDEKDSDMASFANSWSSTSKEENSSAPPDWLNMLTQGDRRQMSGHMPAISPSGPSAPVPQPSAQQLLEQSLAEQQPASPPISQLLRTQEPVAQQPVSTPSLEKIPVVSPPEEEPALAPFASGGTDDEEESFFGPAWLKALGATSIDSEESPEAAANEPSAETIQPTAQEMPRQSSIAYETLAASVPQVSPSLAQEQSSETPWSRPATQESQAASVDSAWRPSSGPVPLSPVSSSEYSWNQPLEVEPPEFYVEEVQDESDEILPPGLKPASTWERPGEAVWRTQPPKADNEHTFGAIPSMHPAEAASSEAAPLDKTEQNLLATLEELENNLRSNGFVPMEPNWLSALAQEQNAPALPPEEHTPSLPTWAQGTYGESPLSSALAELGNFSQQSQQSSNSASPTIDPTPLEEGQSFAQSVSAPATPSWAASLQATPVPRNPEVPLVEEDLWLDDGDAPTSHVAAVRRPVEPVARTIPPAPIVSPSPVPVKKTEEPIRKVEPVKRPAEPAPVARKDAFMDMELETTMKRPAIRLQPMLQKRPVASREQSSLSPKGRSVERAAANKKALDADANYQERLLKGYQHQLVGDYDEAMQEYRTVIRNAPELLGEVISNVRALLKLAPKYSVGYRVLGDAYMRQGEYLQAMEAYNKALTMAKKAKP